VKASAASRKELGVGITQRCAEAPARLLGLRRRWPTLADVTVRAPTPCFRLPPQGRAASLAGFTLIEVLVAMFIFVGVMASLYATWKITLRSNAAALRLTAEAQRSRMAMRTVEDALVSAEMFVQNARHYAFLADTSGSFSALSLVGHMSDSFPGSGYFNDERVRRVTFTVESTDQGRNDLVLRQNSMLAQLDEGQDTYPLVLARDVTLFQLEFWDARRGEWAAEWLFTNQLPVLVRVSLGVGRGPGNQSKQPDQLETRVVRLPAVGVTLDAQGGRPGPQ
jgi:prepilin-type N-terminal cleavage/methylation domain-containing protein